LLLPTLQDILALARATFSTLQGTADEDIVIMGGGADCYWFENIEIQEKAWESFYSQLEFVIVTFKQGMYYPLASEELYGSH
jgi:hypothetical protein